MTPAEGRVAVAGGEVWHRSVGAGPGRPLLLLHGGPGASSIGLSETLVGVDEDRRVVVYDQLGGGRSDRPSDPSLWTVDRFVAEVGEVREALGLDEVHLLGHSWGSMLAASYLFTRPAGVRSVIFSSPCLDARRWHADQRAWLAEMPEDVRRTIAEHEAAGTTASEDYRAATLAYYRRHLCRTDPWPEVVHRMMTTMNGEIYGLMWGASEFTVTGTLRDYDATPGLPSLGLPALFVCGEYDEARPDTVRHHAALVPGAKCHVVAGASHLTMVERPDDYWSLVREFVGDVDRDL